MPFLFVTRDTKQVTRKKQKVSNVSPVTCHLSPAFTLIELLIVITILGILAGLTLASYSGTQERSRDSRRKTDLDAIKKALELARQDTPGAYNYPICINPASDNCLLDDNNSSILAPTYMKAVPKDPKTASGYAYYTLTATNGACTISCVSYKLVTCLENARDTQKDATNNTTVCPTGSNTVSYTITPN